MRRASYFFNQSQEIKGNILNGFDNILTILWKIEQDKRWENARHSRSKDKKFGRKGSAA